MRTDTIKEEQPLIPVKNSTVNIQENTSLTFDKIYDTWVKPLEISPLIFNCFHWIVNCKEQHLLHCFGVRKMLGYDEFTLTLDKIQNLIHPNFRTVIMKLSIKIFDLFKNENYRIYNKEAHFCIQFPIQHINGTYLLVQQNCTILSTDGDYNPVFVYYRFENLGKYIGFPIHIKPRICFNVGIYSVDLEKMAETQLSKEVNTILLDHLSLTHKQTEVLILLSKEKSINDIAQELNISIETIKVHNKTILSKAKKTLSPIFTNAREVSVFLKESLVI